MGSGGSSGGSSSFLKWSKSKIKLVQVCIGSVRGTYVQGTQVVKILTSYNTVLPVTRLFNPQLE